MAIKLRYPAPSFNGVAVSQTATLDLPVDRRYHSLYITYTSTDGAANQAVTEADITQVRILIDGKVQRTFSSRELFDISTLNGIAFSNGILPIYFSEPWRRSALDEEALSWAMANISTFQIEVDLGAGANGPTLNAIITTDANQGPLERIVKWHRRTIAAAGAGVVTYSDFPKRDTYLRMHFSENAAADITDVDISVDNFTVLDVTDAENQLGLADQGFAQVADCFDVIFDHTQRIADGLPMMKLNGRRVSDFRVDVNHTQTDNINVVSETLGNPD